MNITQKSVIEVKQSNKHALHDKSWYDYQNIPEVEAINYALMHSEKTDNLSDIVAAAKNYIKTANAYN